MLKVYFVNADIDVAEALVSFRESNVIYQQIQDELHSKNLKCSKNVYVECTRIVCDGVVTKFLVCSRCDESFLSSHNCGDDKTIVPTLSNTTLRRNHCLSRRNAIYSSSGLHKLLLQRALEGDMIAFELYLNLKFSVWVKDLTTEGIEPNPGPTRCGDIASMLCSLILLTGFVILIVYYSFFSPNAIWKRDLTREGTEPNPGPVTVQLFDEVFHLILPLFWAKIVPEIPNKINPKTSRFIEFLV